MKNKETVLIVVGTFLILLSMGTIAFNHIDDNTLIIQLVQETIIGTIMLVGGLIINEINKKNE